MDRIEGKREECAADSYPRAHHQALCLQVHIYIQPGRQSRKSDTHVCHEIFLSLFHAWFRSISALRSLMVLVISPSTP